jgi:hypothetical protein
MKIACLLSSLLAVHLAAADPADLIKARETYEQASESALKPVKAAYWKELTRMVDEYIKAGKADEAVAVKNELAKLTGGTTAARPANASEREKLIARFVGRTCVTTEGIVTHFTFNKDGSGAAVSHGRKEPFEWEIYDADTVKIQRPRMQQFFRFESRLKGELFATLDGAGRSVIVEEQASK